MIDNDAISLIGYLVIGNAIRYAEEVLLSAKIRECNCHRRRLLENGKKERNEELVGTKGLGG